MHKESLLVHFQQIRILRQEALSLLSINLNTRQLYDLELLLNRGYYPLNGFLHQRDYESVLENMRLSTGELWPMPVCLDVPPELGTRLHSGDKLALRDQEGFLLAILTVSDIWLPDMEYEAQSVFGTQNPTLHPSVEKLFSRKGKYYVGGSMEGLSLPLHFDFDALRLTPSDMNRWFSRKGWGKVIGFQCENHLHRAQKEMISQAARDVGASILLHPVIDGSYYGDLHLYSLVRSWKAFVSQFPSNMATLAIIPMYRRYAGPREALFQALVRRNFGCTHFAMTLDHGDPFAQNHTHFYPLGEACDLVADHEKETGISPVLLQEMVYVEDQDIYCPKDKVKKDARIMSISAEELDQRLEHDIDIPEWFSFREVVEELKKSHPPRHKQGFTIFITGLSGAGKSTIAKVLLARFLEMCQRPVTLLDGDIVRRNLSSELSFSKKDRELNIQRIGFVASEITKNGGIAICAPIAPYPDSRNYNRRLISQYGGFIEVYINTSLDVCEERDRKGLYAKARAGLIKGVTGIDDPYIPPANPELTIDTAQISPAEAAQIVLLHLEQQGYIR